MQVEDKKNTIKRFTALDELYTLFLQKKYD